MLKLYSYFRSSSAYRVRIALNLKGVPYEILPVLEQGSLKLTESLAIIEYLEETYPQPALLPADPAAKAWVRGLALDIACNIQPLNNLRVLQYLKSDCALDVAVRTRWSRAWISRGFTALETRLASHGAGDYCYGTTPTVADCCLIPQVFNAHRVKCPMEGFPNIMLVYETCMRAESFQRAAPERQNDAD